jgi:uncharacterized protein
MELIDLAGEKYVSLTTYRKNGESSAKPVWITGLGDGRIGFTTDATSLKVKRIRNDGRVRLQPCDMRGNVRAGTSPVDADAVILDDGEGDEAIVRAAIAKKYGWQYRVAIGLGKLQALIGRPSAARCAVIISRRS